MIEVSPVVWIVDIENKLLISKRGLISGINIVDKTARHNTDFSKSPVQKYLEKYMIKDLTQDIDYKNYEINRHVKEENQLETVNQKPEPKKKIF